MRNWSREKIEGWVSGHEGNATEPAGVHFGADDQEGDEGVLVNGKGYIQHEKRQQRHASLPERVASSAKRHNLLPDLYFHIHTPHTYALPLHIHRSPCFSPISPWTFMPGTRYRFLVSCHTRLYFSFITLSFCVISFLLFPSCCITETTYTIDVIDDHDQIVQAGFHGSR
jgi:hypothetical protein